MIFDHLAPERAARFQFLGDVPICVKVIKTKWFKALGGNRASRLMRFCISPLSGVLAPKLQDSTLENIFALDCVPLVIGPNRNEVVFGCILYNVSALGLEPGTAFGERIDYGSLLARRENEDINGNCPCLRDDSICLRQGIICLVDAVLSNVDGGIKGVQKAGLSCNVRTKQNNELGKLDVNRASAAEVTDSNFGDVDSVLYHASESLSTTSVRAKTLEQSSQRLSPELTASMWQRTKTSLAFLQRCM